MPNGQAFTSLTCRWKPNLQFGRVVLRPFWGINYFSYLLVGCNCSSRGENVYACSHALTAFHMCESLLNIYFCTPPTTPAISRYTEKLSSDPLLE